MARLGFSSVLLGLFWFGLTPCFKKREEKTGGEKTVGEKHSGEKTEQGKT